MTREQNPYSPAIALSDSMAEQIRKGATWAAVFGALAIFLGWVFAPFAIYHGHRCLRRIRRENVGFEHRGAAWAGATLGWLGCAYFVMAAVLELRWAFGR